MKKEYNSNGKLLITGEYLILKGALALAVPVKFGQKMVIEEGEGDNILIWKNFDNKNNCWAEVIFLKSDLAVYRDTLKTIETPVYETLQKILIECRNANPAFLKNNGITTITNYLNFDRSWGLGSSSTLLNNLASCANVDPFHLNKKIFGGSGYDIACARSGKPLMYRIDEEGGIFDTVHFNPPSPENIFFIHLNKKQDSKTAVEEFLENKDPFDEQIEVISEISEALLFCDEFPDFIQLIGEHELVMEFVLQKERIQSLLFDDFNGVVKSLGAWGGDFVMAASEMDPTETEKYFRDKNFPVIINYSDMVLD